MFYSLSEKEIIQTLPSRFEDWAARIPDQDALLYKNRRITYQQLNERANGVADALLNALDVGPEPVILLLEDPITNISAQLGALKAQKLCIPMDVSFPPARQRQILSSSGARLIVTERKQLERAHEICEKTTQLLNLDEIGGSSHNSQLAKASSSLAYVLYTSGSTGQPKGVMLNHRILMRVSKFYNRVLDVGISSRVTSPTSLAYAGTIWALLGTILNGATFVITRFDSPGNFLDSLVRYKINVAQMLVTLLKQLMRAINEPIHSPYLRMVFTGGEVLNKQDLRKFVETFPVQCGLVYNFGSTEAGVISHVQMDLENLRNGTWETSDDAILSSGKTQQDTEILLLDEAGTATSPPGDGELAVRSRFLSDGYWNDPAQTKKCFPADLANEHGTVYRTGDVVRVGPDGSIFYLGRRDAQIKVRGYRINLNEVERALESIDGISAAAAIGVENHEGKNQIVAYIQWNGSSRLNSTDLRKAVAELLPGYMVPANFLVLKQLPVTAGGKLDRMALPRPENFQSEGHYNLQKPKTFVERILCQTLSDLLNRPVGTSDDIFELGADSMTVFQLIARIKNSLQFDLDANTVFSSPVIEDLARGIDQLRQG